MPSVFSRGPSGGAWSAGAHASLHLAWNGHQLHAWGQSTGPARFTATPVAGLPPMYPRAAGVDTVAEMAGLPRGRRPSIRLMRVRLPRPDARPTEPSAAYVVPALVLGPSIMGAALFLPLPAFDTAPRTHRGKAPWDAAPDALYWRRIARLALALAARGGFVPGLAGAVPAAAWLPTPTPSERAALAALAAAMPADAVELSAPLTPAASVEAFLAACLDAWVRQCLARHRPSWSRDLRGDRPDGRWMLGLLNPVALPAASDEPFVREVEPWSSEARYGAPAVVRLVVRLADPEPEAAPAPAGPPAPAAAPALRWPVQVLAQVPDDAGSVAAGPLVPVRDLWRGDIRALDGDRRLGLRQSALLALRAAARVCPPLAAALGEPPAGAFTLPLDAAEQLAEAEPELAACGVDVVVPVWWREQPARVSATLHLEDAPSPGARAAAGVGDWTAFRWDLAVGGEQIPPEAFERLVAGRQALVRLRSGWVRVDPASLRRVAEQWAETGGAGTVQTATALRLALEAGPLGARAASASAPDAADDQDLDDGDDGDVSVVANGRVAGWLAGLREDRRMEPLGEPSGFRGTLRPYQRRGLGWLAFLADLGLGGCLADDMGLGKTVQVIALLALRKAAGLTSGPSLLVCPTSVLGNWSAELQRFAPHLAAHAHYGAARPRGERLRWLCAQADLVVTSYGLLQRDAADLATVSWDGVILDEAQNVKNPIALQAQASRTLEARYRFALTGTPVENSLRDLWSIFAFALPGYLGGGRAFTREYAAPIGRGEEGAAARLRRVIAPFVLRRTKRDPGVAEELPPKIDMRQDCVLSAEQASLYEAYVREAMAGIAGARGMVRRAAVLTTLLRLKQICDHPCLFTGDGGGLAGRSGKLQRLEQLLEDVIGEGDRALIFTQFATWARHLAPYLAERCGCEVLCLVGSTPGADRADIVRRFQEGQGPGLLVLSLRAGGVGLNLTAAQHVFHYDRWWNPAVEQQATDRAYRIGQVRTVQVHRLIVRGTLEDRIDDMLREKAGLAEQVVGGAGEAWLTELSTDALREILTLRGGDDR